MATDDIDAPTEQALVEATTQGITGKAMTPFVLARASSTARGSGADRAHRHTAKPRRQIRGRFQTEVQRGG
ncbi:hypothetical protein AWB75_06672 [Caballeronia catudaia]|uniref:Uncharacterized protein n=1 Tax=Caballeronia catudaia TaxID=1777136 RepID=A0A158DFM7_9BURK|nr:hypothetical protein [Caballeronia catudaia]SAK93399.1 hypothetical protein AWB75_06672 [Caballeronia catudaia]